MNTKSKPKMDIESLNVVPLADDEEVSVSGGEATSRQYFSTLESMGTRIKDFGFGILTPIGWGGAALESFGGFMVAYIDSSE